MNRSLLKFIVFIIAISKLALGQSPEDMNNVFQSNAVMFNIPADILKSIAYTESRFSHVIPDDSQSACAGIPHSYGIMGLRNDDWFGRSLLDAANLISATPQMLIYNYELNIRGAAALLSKYFLKEQIQTVSQSNHMRNLTCGNLAKKLTLIIS